MGGPEFSIAGRRIGAGHPAYIIAELSGNHGQDLECAKDLVRVAAQAGVDAVKLQTYTPDTITIECRNEHFQIKQGTLWDGKVLYDLYREAFTPWEWYPELAGLAQEFGVHCFSSPFDPSAVDFLEAQGVAAYKIASFELVDIPLVRKIAATQKPIILSTGMAELSEIDEAVAAIRDVGSAPVSLLRTNSGYPASPDEMDLVTIPDLAARFGCVVGLSDHTLGTAVPVAAVALGAHIIEKHLTNSRSAGGPDAAFSLEPDELRTMVDAIRTAERALGRVRYGPTEREKASLPFRRSLFVVEDVKAEEVFTERNVRSIRPASGLHPRHLSEVLGRRAARDLPRGTPLRFDMIS